METRAFIVPQTSSPASAHRNKWSEKIIFLSDTHNLFMNSKHC